MRRSLAALTVGALTLVVLAATYLLVQYTSERMGTGKGYRVYGLFRNALGIYEKTRVLSAGLRIGQVEERVLDQDSGKAKVFVRIDPEIRLYENATVGKKSASLLGEYYLDIDPGTPFEMKNGKKVEVPLLKDGDQIKDVTEPTEVGDIMDAVSVTLPVLKAILDDLKGLTAGPIKDIANNTNEMIERNSIIVERLLGRMDEIAATVEGIAKSEADDVRVAIRNVREITEGIKGLVGTTQGQVSGAGEDLRSSLQKLQHSIDSLDKSLDHVEKITGKVADGEGTVGHLVTDDTVARNLDDITDDAKGLLRGVARLQTIVGLRTEYNYLASTFKNYVTVTLMPRPDKFYMIEIVDDPRGYRKKQSVQGVDSRTGAYSTTTITTSEQLRLTFMFGKRIGPFAGRFGIKESTGGVGADLYLFDDRLLLSADIFDMRSNQYPRFTARASLAVYKRYIYLVGGVDDVFNYVRTQGTAGGFFDWFLGAQLVFNDEDLKSLLLFGGGSAASSASK
ncbi:MAG: MCE family protein [Deltaproteobacteria bacterium]|nr:MCE family protein [Deltaproteobacteria bacterium]